MKHIQVIITFIVLFSCFIQLSKAQDSRIFEKTIPYKPVKEIKLKFDQFEVVKVHSWEKSEIKLKANIDLSDTKGKSKNKDFDITSDINWKAIKLKSTVADNKYTTLVSKSGSDIEAHDKNTLVSGSIIDIWVPENTNLEIESSLGKVEVDYNGGSLLVSNNNNIILHCKNDIDANFNVSTFMGNILLDEVFNVVIKTKGGLKSLSSNNITFKQNSGKQEISLRTMVGNITISTKEE